MSYETEKQVAIAAALEAGKLCESVRREISPQAIEKKDKSPVTIADFGSQALICRALEQAFPEDAIVGEEDAAELRTPEMADPLAQVTQYVGAIAPGATSDQIIHWIDRGNGEAQQRFWTLDPIDGTKGFLRGDQYAVALALIEHGIVQVGVMVCPAMPLNLDNPEEGMGVIFVAVRGQGAEMMPMAGGELRPIKVVSTDNPKGLRFVGSVESAHGDQSRQAAVAQAVGFTEPPLPMDSQAKYGAVASGQAALYLRLPSPKSPDYREKIWDHAAGAIVVEEAGGRVTDMFGQSLDFSKGAKLIDNQGIVVSNGIIHDKVIEALKQSSPSSAVSA
jgi:3'(2'), 5'-bisphosphate nucleotidase